jgi:hypothetical protein
VSHCDFDEEFLLITPLIWHAADFNPLLDKLHFTQTALLVNIKELTFTFKLPPIQTQKSAERENFLKKKSSSDPLSTIRRGPILLISSGREILSF